MKGGLPVTFRVNCVPPLLTVRSDTGTNAYRSTVRTLTAEDLLSPSSVIEVNLLGFPYLTEFTGGSTATYCTPSLIFYIAREIQGTWHNVTPTDVFTTGSIPISYRAFDYSHIPGLGPSRYSLRHQWDTSKKYPASTPT